MITSKAINPVVTYADVTTFASDKFVQEASTLGLPPGVWPSMLLTTIGTGKPFLLETTKADGIRVYKQALGCIELHILND